MIDKATGPFKKAPVGTKENHQGLGEPQNISGDKTSLDAAQPAQNHDGHHHNQGFHPHDEE